MVITMATQVLPATTTPVPPSVAAGRGGPVRFTVADVLSMVRQGILAEDATTELLDGLVVHKDRSEQGADPMSHGPRHRKCVRKLAALSGRIDSADRHAQSQLPIVCGDGEMPEPDFAVVRGTDDDYDAALPTAADAFCVVEVADSSLERDRDEKLPVYAAAGVAWYLIVNLRSDTLELYTDPDPTGRQYRSTQVIRAGESLRMPLGGGLGLDLAAVDVLP